MVLLRRAFPDLRAFVEAEIVEGTTVVHRLTLAGTHEGAFLGVLPTGRSVTWYQVEILRAGPDDRFADRWSSWDQLGLRQQLGDVLEDTEERS